MLVPSSTKKTVLASFITILSLSALVAWRFVVTTSPKIPKNLNFLPSEFSTVGVNNQWTLRSIQPIAGKFVNEGEFTYLEASLYDQAGKLKKFRLLVAGKINDTLTVTRIPFSDSQTKGLITLDELKQKITPGTQIRVQLVTGRAVQINEETQDCVKYANFCEFHELTKPVLTSDNILNTSILTPKTIIPVLTVSLHLYQSSPNDQ